MKTLPIDNKLTEIQHIRNSVRDSFFKLERDPHTKNRNRWREFTQMLANIKDDGYIGGESGISEVGIDNALLFFRKIETLTLFH